MEHHNIAPSSSHDTLPRIYVTCLASYNNGILHGSWIYLDGSENITESIALMLQNPPTSNSEEWAIHDSEFCGELSEYTGIVSLINIQEAFLKLSESITDWELFSDFCECMGLHLDVESVNTFSQNYAGSAPSLESWCNDLLESTGELESIPNHLKYYFNLSAYAKDLEISDIITFQHAEETHVFWRF